MIINHAEDGHGAEGLDEKTALPSKHVISSFGSITNGFLFSTTPIILKILQTICNNLDESANSFIISGWLYGSIVGILLFGFIGDILGYYKGMILSSSLSFIGILSSAFSLFLPNSIVPFVFGCARIVLGIGCGGSIPIAYTRTDTSNKKSISQTSSLLLLLQSSSWLIGPILFNFSISYFGESVESLRRILCIILCCASIPSLLSILILLKSYNSILYVPLMTNDEETEVAVEITESSRPQSLFISFVGTGITWFLYDYNSYGNTFFSKSILRPVLPMEDTPLASTIPIILAGLFGVPGQFVVHAILKRLDPRKTQIAVIGFFVLGFLFLIAGIGFSFSVSYHNYLLVIIYHLTFFFSTCGPGSTTYILPSLYYSKDVLSLYHGVCTCMGKLGGAIGSTLFPTLITKIGISNTLFVSCTLSFLAGVFTWLLSPL